MEVRALAALAPGQELPVPTGYEARCRPHSQKRLILGLFNDTVSIVDVT